MSILRNSNKSVAPPTLPLSRYPGKLQYCSWQEGVSPDQLPYTQVVFSSPLSSNPS